MKSSTVFAWLFLSSLLLAQQPSGNVGKVDIPGVKGVLELNVGPSPWYLEFVPEDKWAMLHARQRPDNVRITALLRQVPFAAGSESCKAEMWPKVKQTLAGKTENLQESSYGGAARVEYTFTGEDTKSHHLLAYWGARDLCAEVHLIKTGFTPQDQTAFEQVLSSVRMFPDASGLQAGTQAQDNSSMLMAQANELYAQADYAGAGKLYQRAFDLESKNRTFDKDLFLDLISRLAFCYRLNGSLAKARQTLEYGLSQDSEYPLFHYDMACVYAQMGKMDESLGHLSEAYKYQRNAPLGEMPPNPTEDSCFQKFANDPRFADAVQKMLPPSQ